MGVLPMTRSDASSSLGLLFLFVQFALSPGALCQEVRPGDADVVSTTDLPSPLSGTWKNLAKLRNKAALRFFEQGNHPAALEAFREAARLDPEDPEITNNLAYLLQLLGNRAEAEKYYRRTLELDPDRYVAHVNLADLLGEDGETTDRLSEAAALLVRARELKGNRASIILRQARVASRRGLVEEGVRFWNDYAAIEPPGDEKKLEIGDFYLEFGREDEALSWFRQVEGKRTELRSQAARRIWQIEVDREARRLGWQPRGDDVPVKARMLISQGRARLREEDHDEALRLFREAAAMAPQSPDAHLGLAEIHRHREAWGEAELECLRALSMESGNADIHATLGRLYRDWPDGRRMKEAAFFLSNAVRLRPDWSSLRLELAQARRAGGDPTGALVEVNRLLAEAVEGDEKSRAEQLRGDLLRMIPPAGSHSAELVSGPEAQPDDADSILARAQALLARGSPEGALLELRRMPDREHSLSAQMLEARILHLAERRDEAKICLRRALAVAPGDAEASALLGGLLAAEGRMEEALPHLRLAAAEGDPASRFLVAEADWVALAAGRPSWWVGLADRDRLESLRHELEGLIESGADFPQRDRALGLLDRVESGLAGRWYLPAVASVAAVLIVLLFLWWWYGGTGLTSLIRRHPEAAPELHRILAAVRHEVLKHNTMMLTGLLKGLVRGDNVADEAARLHEALFGGQGNHEGALGRLHDYRSRLEQEGRSHGIRLNLSRDPVFGPLLLGFRQLRECSADLLRVEFLAPVDRTRLAARLEGASKLLNVRGYEALRSLLDRFRTTRVDRNTVTDAFRRVVAEPDLAAAGHVELKYGEEGEFPSGIPVPLSAVDDILVNLTRNAIQAMLRQCDGPVEVGLGLRRVADPVTGLERLSFLVADRSPEPLTMERIRGGRAGGGLGLVVELVDRYEGSLDVLPGGDGFRKVVAVTFPCRSDLPEWRK